MNLISMAWSDSQILYGSCTVPHGGNKRHYGTSHLCGRRRTSEGLHAHEQFENRLELSTRRRLRDVVQTYIGSGYKNQAAEGEIRTRFGAWRDNDARLHPLLEQSFLLNELALLSEDLSTLAAAGLLALDYLKKSTPSPNAWRVQQLRLVERAKTPKADLLPIANGG